MANILDYLDWRGDIPVTADGFNEVDSLIFAKLVHIDFSGIVPAPGEGCGVRLCDAASAYFASRGETGQDMGVFVPGDTPELLRRAAESKRFRDVILSAYEEILDEEAEEQFAAMCAEVGDGTVYCAFRGTDDTLVGWKEDLNMGVLETIPSQRQSLDYLQRAARQHKGLALRVGGHSKGGNLAVYSASYAPEAVQDRIVQVYDNDGPGFRSDLSDEPGYRRIASRIRTIKPQSSIVGQILEHSQHVTVVHSTGTGIGQHNGFTWEVHGREFVHLSDFSREGKRTEETLESVAAELSIPQRKAFVEALYEVLTGTGARTLSDLNEEKLKSAAGMLKTYHGLDDETRQALSAALMVLVKHSAKHFMHDVRQTQDKNMVELRRKAEELWHRFFERDAQDEKPGDDASKE